jgi:ABC-type transport system substrate-binding protein
MLLAVSALSLGGLRPASARTGGAPRYGGTVVVALAIGAPSTLDSTFSISGYNTEEVFSTICEGLYDVDGNGQIVPLLASALPRISKDKLTYTIPLRKGILFNDGTPFNAQAVVATLQRDLTVPTSRRVGDLSSVQSVSATDPSTVVIQLKEPFTPLTATLTHSRCGAWAASGAHWLPLSDTNLTWNGPARGRQLDGARAGRPGGSPSRRLRRGGSRLRSTARQATRLEEPVDGLADA